MLTLRLRLPHPCCNLLLLPCSCCVNAVVQVLLDVYGTYFPESKAIGRYQGLLAHLHGLVVNRGGTAAASAEVLVQWLVHDNILKLTDRDVPVDNNNRLRVQQEDAQCVLWLILERLADEV